jgi:hypothetical protein
LFRIESIPSNHSSSTVLNFELIAKGVEIRIGDATYPVDDLVSLLEGIGVVIQEQVSLYLIVPCSSEGYVGVC